MGLEQMANFEKRSFWYMCAMSFVTFGLYSMAWIVDTARDLRRAGGKVPSSYFYFGPILAAVVVYFFGAAICISHGFDIDKWVIISRLGFMIVFTIFSAYFWFGYVRSYCQIIRHKNDKKSVWSYFILFKILPLTPVILILFLSLIKPIFLLAFINSVQIAHPVIAGLVQYVFWIIWINSFNFLFFQRGFNSYVDQNR